MSKISYLPLSGVLKQDSAGFHSQDVYDQAESAVEKRRAVAQTV